MIFWHHYCSVVIIAILVIQLPSPSQADRFQYTACVGICLFGCEGGPTLLGFTFGGPMGAGFALEKTTALCIGSCAALCAPFVKD